MSIHPRRYRASDPATRGGMTSNAAALRARGISLPVLRVIELSVEAAQARETFHRWLADSKVRAVVTHTTDGIDRAGSRLCELHQVTARAVVVNWKSRPQLSVRTMARVAIVSIH